MCQHRTDIDGQFCNKTVKECDEDKPNCMSYHYLYTNKTEMFGKGCAKDDECKNTTKTCENYEKKNQQLETCAIWCCQKPQCNSGSTQSHILISILAFLLELSIMFSENLPSCLLQI